MTMAAITYIERQPSHSPTSPLITREARMPVSNPETIRPTLAPFFSGREYWAAMGMNICGMTEQAPTANDAAITAWKLFDSAIHSKAIVSMEKLYETIFLRSNLSPEGMMKNNPQAYPTCVIMAMRLVLHSSMPRSFPIRERSGWQ